MFSQANTLNNYVILRFLVHVNLLWLYRFNDRKGKEVAIVTGGGSGQWPTAWTAVEEKNESVGQATDKLLGRKVRAVVMRWC